MMKSGREDMHENDGAGGKGLSKRWLWGILAAGVVGGAGTLATQDIVPTIVDPQQYGVRVRNGQLDVANQHLQPGLYWTRPIFDTIYKLKENTIILDLDSIGDTSEPNTQDQNILRAKMRMHYKNDPKSGVIAFHVSDMSQDDGKELLTKLLSQSFDAAAGSEKAVGALNDPRKFLFTLADNLQWRLNQNNVAIELDAFELLQFTVGDGKKPLRTPVMLRLKRAEDGKWRAEDITGPAIVSAPNAAAAPTAPKP